MKKYACVAINDECTECSVCGRAELKRVMWLVTLDGDGNKDGDAFPVGSSCGATMLGYTQSKIGTFAKNFAHEIWRIRYSLQQQKENELGYHRVLDELNAMKLPRNERMQHPLNSKIHEIHKIAKEWADAQPVMVNI